jgi:hypothetical protein
MTGKDKKPRSPQDVLAMLDDQIAMDDAMDAIDAMSDEEVQASLRKEGVDPAADLAKDKELLERLKEKSKAKVIPIGSRRPSRWILAGGTVAAAAAMLLLVLGLVGVGPIASVFTPEGPTATGSAPPPDPAEEHRLKAYEACFEHNYLACLRELDAAERIDGHEKNISAAQNARQFAVQGLAAPTGSQK